MKGKTIYPTDRGMTMIERFPVEDLKSAEMTAHWEKRLDDIEMCIRDSNCPVVRTTYVSDL